MVQYSRVACVTGANKGIGLAIVRQLALQYPKSQLNSGPLLIYLLSRDEARGRRALEELKGDSSLQSSKALSSQGGPVDIENHAFDVSNDKSITDFRDFLKATHPDGVDIVINNAAVALDGFDAQVVRDTMKTNYYGTITANHLLLPVIRQGGRLVNVSSSAGRLRRFTPQLADRCRNASKLEDVASMLQDFEKAVEAGREKEAGFPSAAYATSKLALNTATRIIAAEEKQKGSTVLINCCDPGWVNTDMTKGRGPKTPDQGAETPVHLALGDIGNRTGMYWCDKKPEDP